MGRQVGVILRFEVSVSFDVPWRTVHSLLLAATENTVGVLHDPTAVHQPDHAGPDARGPMS